MRFIHTSDWQLGMTRHFLSAEAQARFTQDRIDSIRTLGRLAEERGATFMVVAGDVFESNQLAPQTLSRTLDALASLPVPVFLLPGNHDPLDAASLYDTLPFRTAPAHVRVLRDATPLAVPGQEGIEVVGAPWTSKRPLDDLCGALLKGLGPASRLRVAVAHGQVDRLSPESGRPDVIHLATAEQAVRDGRIHYLALGDRHSLTRVGDTGAIWYSGTPLATDFDEIEPNKALLVDLDTAHRPHVEPLLVGHWHFLAHHEVLHELTDVTRLGRRLAALSEKERCVVRLGLEGAIGLATAAALERVLEENAPRFASLRCHERASDLVMAPDAFDQDSVALTGYAKAAWDELVAAAEGTGEKAEAARDALALFYRLSQGEAA